jgi:hypothetical protein
MPPSDAPFAHGARMIDGLLALARRIFTERWVGVTGGRHMRPLPALARGLMERLRNYMVALAWLLIIAVASLIIVRLGTTALTLTGLARDTAEFQAYSAFFGVGFTTRESEQVVNHPVRRRIVQHLILAGQIGLTSVIVPLVVTFVNVHSVTDGMKQLTLIVGALVLLWLVARTQLSRKLIDHSVRFALRRASPFRQSHDHEVLLRLNSGFVVSEVAVAPNHAMAGRVLAEFGLDEKGIVVLGIARENGVYVGVPRGRTVCKPLDVLIVYGRADDVERLMTVPAPATGGDVDSHGEV